MLSLELMSLDLGLIVAKDLEDDWEVVDVVEEGPAHFDVEVLGVVEDELHLGRVLHRLGGEGLVVSVEEVELAEDVRVRLGDGRGLLDDHPETELLLLGHVRWEDQLGRLI